VKILSVTPIGCLKFKGISTKEQWRKLENTFENKIYGLTCIPSDCIFETTRKSTTEWIWDRIKDGIRKNDTTSKDTTPTNCPNCGAVIDIQVDRCAYCDTPYTFAMANDDTSTVKLYADNIVVCEMHADMNRKFTESMKKQRGMV
jgi:hypothetical protein